MANRVSNIITRARDTLSDPSAQRWTDARLLRILDEGQKQIVLTAQLLRKKSTLPLLMGIANYSVPSDCYKILRVLVDGGVVPINSHEEMDDFADRDVVRTVSENWEEYVSSPVTRIVFDKLNTGKFKVYPIPENPETSWNIVNESGDLLTIPFGILSGATSYSFSGQYGICADYSDDFTNQYQQIDDDVSDSLGLTVVFDDDSTNLTLYYLKRPVEIALATGVTDLTTIDDPEIDSVWDTALKYYVTGMAMRDDKDTQNRQVGNEELLFYASNVKDAMKDSASDFTSTRTQYVSPYDNGF